ncbi:hypothetical protein LTR62_006635 [Meristemomyces frigidus]|uniref:Uncharacterized protein n=1 Tax=Meristemomyces frigidus TaxID=1508187 RepID=A0AAN7YMK2_9PEZI|nr:hypothetical protein LTR62_006635 [Meristemomyces frigidus]
MTAIPSLSTLTLGLPPSCISFSPKYPEYFVVGTYHLHPQKSGEEGAAQQRSGSLLLYKLTGDDMYWTHLPVLAEGVFIVDEDELVGTVLTPKFSILHLEWSPHGHDGDPDSLAVATSTGSLVFYESSPQDGSLVEVNRKQICDVDVLVLHLAWHPTREDYVGVALSDGRVCLCSFPADGEGVEVIEVARHSLEAWFLAFYDESSGSSTIFSGGDDMVLQQSTIDSDGSATQLWQDRRLHQAGITAILRLSTELIVTGSYDDHIRLISTPKTGRRQVLAESNLEGGVWRLKVLSDSEQLANTNPSTAQLQEASLVPSSTTLPAQPNVTRYTVPPFSKDPPSNLSVEPHENGR